MSRDSILITSFMSSVTSDSRFLPSPVETRLNLQTGLIENSSGARGLERVFYSNSYDLHGDDDDLEFQVYGDEGSRGIDEAIVRFVSSGLDGSPRPGAILDVGCGKGLLLRELSSMYPEASIHGVEPNHRAVERARRIVPEVPIWQGMLEETPVVAKGHQYDLVLIHGVLEHVPSPLDFLNTIICLMEDSGHLFVGVPNFETNVADLLTYDHLTRFTPQSIIQAFSSVGLEVVFAQHSSEAVPMWFLVRKARSARESVISFDSLVGHSLEIATSNSVALAMQLSQLQTASLRCLFQDVPLKVFGTGTLLVYAHGDERLPRDLCLEVFDDNPAQHGSTFMGHTVRPLEESDSTPGQFVFLNANPCYHARMTDRVRAALGPEVEVFGAD